MRKRSLGFTLLELIIVVAILIVVASFASFGFVTALRHAQINNAVQLVENQLRSTHQLAMDRRTEYVVTFTAPGHIDIQGIQNAQLFAAGSIDLPSNEQFLAISGIPTGAKTPDGFGSGTQAIDFDQAVGGAGNVLYFYPDGTVLDAVGNPNNGVIYVARPGDLYSSRAITIWGTSGRIKAWKLVPKTGGPQWQ